MLFNLRYSPTPYDWERDDDTVTVELSPVEWSILVAGAQRSHIAECVELADEVARRVTDVQAKRYAAIVGDAEYEVRRG